MPNVEPQLSALAANYPPETGRALSDLVLRVPFWLRLPFTFTQADASALYTVPAGLRMFVHQTGWEVTTSFTGGTTPAIGLSSDDLDYNVKGDLLGGAAGDLTATLVATNPGTSKLLKGVAGAKFTRSATAGLICLLPGKIIRFDRIADAFTAGVANAMLQCSFVPAV